MKTSIAKVRGRLPVGTEFVGEFVGENRRVCKPGMEITRRRVVINSPTRLVSEFLDGPRVGEVIYLNWRGLTAEEVDDGSILVSADDNGTPDTFLKITFPAPAV